MDCTLSLSRTDDSLRGLTTERLTEMMRTATIELKLRLFDELRRRADTLARR